MNYVIKAEEEERADDTQEKAEGYADHSELEVLPRSTNE